MQKMYIHVNDSNTINSPVTNTTVYGPCYKKEPLLFALNSALGLLAQRPAYTDEKGHPRTHTHAAKLNAPLQTRMYTPRRSENTRKLRTVSSVICLSAKKQHKTKFLLL